MKIKKWIKRQWKQFNTSPPVLVLMYHRVINLELDPWNKLVRPLSHINKLIQNKNNTHPSLFITFDDGYMDNFLNAKPILEAYDLPATFFISTKQIGTSQTFWWDELTDLILNSPVLPKDLDLNFTHSFFSFDLKNDRILTEKLRNLHKTWNATLPPPSLRAQLYVDLWGYLSNLEYHEQQQIMGQLREWAGKYSEDFEMNNISMEKSQLQSLSFNPLFQIGAHTNSHPLLPRLNKEEQKKEIYESKQFLESMSNLSIDSFAYPSGKFDQNTLEILKSQGFKTAFTTNPRLVKPTTDPLLIGRYQVNNWTGKEFKQQLSKWMS